MEERTPLEEPRLFGSGPQDFLLTAHLGLGQQAEELTTLLRPTPTNFAGEDHQPGAPVLTSQFRYRASLRQRATSRAAPIFVRTPKVRCPIPAQDRHESGVHPNLGPVKQGKAVKHARIGHVRHANDQLHDTHEPLLSRETPPRSGTLERTATPAGARSGEKGEPTTAKEQDSEKLGRADPWSRGQTDVDMKKSSAFWAALCCHRERQVSFWWRPHPPSGRQGVRLTTPARSALPLGRVVTGSCSTHLPNLTKKLQPCLHTGLLMPRPPMCKT